MILSAVVIAGGKRTALIDERILPTLTGFDEVFVVGRHHDGGGYNYLYVPDLTKTTNDALVKRDVGTLAATGDVIAYFSDDHCAGPMFTEEVREFERQGLAPWDVLIPSRWVQHPEHHRIRIPNGEQEFYCAGHGGVFRRRVIQARPWTAQQHHRNWDLITSHDHIRAGFKYLAYPRLQIEDLEPENHPWE